MTVVQEPPRSRGGRVLLLLHLLLFKPAPPQMWVVWPLPRLPVPRHQTQAAPSCPRHQVFDLRGYCNRRPPPDVRCSLSCGREVPVESVRFVTWDRGDFYSLARQSRDVNELSWQLYYGLRAQRRIQEIRTNFFAACRCQYCDFILKYFLHTLRINP